MDQIDTKGKSRRHFLTTVVPACAATCLGFQAALARHESQTPKSGKADPDDLHPFDEQFPRKLTYRRFYRMQYRGEIGLAKFLKEEIGADQAIALLKKNTEHNMTRMGRAQAARTDNHSLHQYTEQFRQMENYKSRLEMEIVEDSEQAFELKVTKCIWASTFLEAKAGDLGFAMVCHGDYAWAESFNPKIKLVRDKTLMEGDPICNHRYVWTG
jgi:hypothetical protein